MQSDDLEWLEAHRLRAPLLLLALDALAAGNREDGKVQACKQSHCEGGVPSANPLAEA